MSERDPASEQLQNYKKKNVKSMPLINNNGCPIDDRMHTLTVGPRGPILLEDTLFLDEITHFDRERIPERVVHAKGAGAFGEFEVTHDIRRFCRASLFSRLGKKTPIAVRFSTVGGENGSADTVRDPRGFAIKFYTEEGNWDLVGNNSPVFFIRDPILFPSLIHSQKRNPVTHLRDPDMFWDFITLRPESTHQVLLLFADRGIPDGYRFMNGYSCHAYKLVNEKSEIFYCKFHYKSTQGVKNLLPGRARELSATDPDYSIRDLYNAIENVDLPSWTLFIQVMTVQQAAKNRFNPFDLTKIWPHSEYPLIPVGKFLLNKNPRNYFAEIEQLAFSPAHLVPGIEPSPDKMLLGRLFSYGDAQRYRLGSNYLQIPVNCPYRSSTANYQRDGQSLFSNQGEAPNYFPNSFNGPIEERRFKPHVFHCSGDVARYGGGDEDNYGQAAEFWNRVLLLEEKDRLVANVCEHLKHAAESLQERAVKMFTNVGPDLGHQIAEKLKLKKMDSKF